MIVLHVLRNSQDQYDDSMFSASRYWMYPGGYWLVAQCCSCNCLYKGMIQKLSDRLLGMSNEAK